MIPQVYCNIKHCSYILIEHLYLEDILPTMYTSCKRKISRKCLTIASMTFAVYTETRQRSDLHEEVISINEHITCIDERLFK